MKSLRFDRNARRGLATRLIAGATFVSAVALPPSVMALTDIANAPISSAATTTVPPNVLFILDGSGSMGSDYMPDDASSFSGDVGGKSHLCNTIYYNPAVTYLAPKKADGTDFANSNFLSASSDGFLGGGTSNLSTSFQPNGSSSNEPAYYYKWNGAAPPGFTTDCQIGDSSSFPHVTAPLQWEKVRITAAAEQQNFANWYTYYRTRMLLMKSAAGRAFNGLTDTFRVGFITICPDSSSCSDDNQVTPVTAAEYLKIDAFTPTHKAAWYTKFYSQAPGGFTPLRRAPALAAAA